ncbi:MAG: hypothetical protein ACJ72M_18085 [Propionibacteriaceae bacterium]
MTIAVDDVKKLGGHWSSWTWKSLKRWPVSRLLRRAAELVWNQDDVAGPRSSHQLLALGIDPAADQASGLLPRRARLDGRTLVGDNSAELLNSADDHVTEIAETYRGRAS